MAEKKLIQVKYFKKYKCLKQKKTQQKSPEQAEHFGTRMVEIAQSMKEQLADEEVQQEHNRCECLNAFTPIDETEN